MIEVELKAETPPKDENGGDEAVIPEVETTTMQKRDSPISPGEKIYLKSPDGLELEIFSVNFNAVELSNLAIQILNNQRGILRGQRKDPVGVG